MKEKNDIILINPKITSPYEQKYPPFAYLFIAPKLNRAGYKVKVFDLQVDNHKVFEDILNGSSPIWIGFSIMTGTAIRNALQIAKYIRNLNPRIPLVWGGPHPTLLPLETLQHPLVDIVVVGEGEHTSVELTEALLKGGDTLYGVKGIGFKKNGKIILNPNREFIKNWDEEVEYGWKFVNVEKYIQVSKGRRVLPLVTSRGCPWKCGFCWNMKANSRIWRGWSNERVIQEIEKLNIQYNINHIAFHDDYREDLFFDEKVISFFKKKRIYWSSDSGFRISKRISEYYMKQWKESYCFNLCFGAETASQRIADYIDKCIEVDNILYTAELTAKYDVPVKYNWMIGFPTETLYDIKLTLDVIDKIRNINPKSSHFVGLYTPYPGTPLYEKVVNLGYRPLTSLEEWSLLREEMKLPFWEKPWYLRCISLTAFFSFVIDTSGWSGSASKNLYRPFIWALKQSSLLRWKNKFFSLPFEFMILLELKKILKI